MAAEKRHRIHQEITRRSRELRHPMTPAEAKLWRVLRGRSMGAFKFRRQHPIEYFIVDFYCAEARLVIEVDGGIHASQQAYDANRTEWLQAQGYTVIRFQNRDVWGNLDEVVGEIMKICNQRTGKGDANP